jgi:coenzyme PQQ precursor peptide PqqA
VGTQLRDLSSLSAFFRNSARPSSDNLVRCSNHVTQPAADARFDAVGPEWATRRETQGVKSMAWNVPVVVEVCAGMEVTAYLSAEM